MLWTIFKSNTPLFKNAKIRLNPEYHSCSVDKYFSIECDNEPLEFPYIKSMSFNGVTLDRPYLTYSEITSGGKLSFELSKEPCETFGKSVPDSFVD